jgi:sugar phosphate isomerase/epimerase
VTRPRPFGISTHLFHAQRLTRDQLREIGAHGFELVELFATRTHFDYGNPACVADLQGWLADAAVELTSVHGPVGESFAGGRWQSPFSLASPDAAVRQRALAETELALQIARRIPYRLLVLHLGVAKTPQSVPGENSRDAARRSIEELQRLAEPLGVTLALEVMANDLSRAASLVHFIENVVDGQQPGICLDFGHAHVAGDLAEAVETVSEHLVAAHVHDNRGRVSDHLMPFAGTIDWASALTALQKVGYEGPLIFEVGAAGASKATLEKLKDVRRRMERMLAE